MTSRPRRARTTISIWSHGRGTLRLTDPRRFGAVLWSPALGRRSGGHAAVAPGRRALRPGADAGSRCTQRCSRRKVAIKSAAAGRARWWSVPATSTPAKRCFAAGIDPRTRCDRLSRPRCDRLLAALRVTLARALDLGGSTLRDFSDAHGAAGAFQAEAGVYGRDGDCRARLCGTVVRRMRAGAALDLFLPVLPAPALSPSKAAHRLLSADVSQPRRRAKAWASMRLPWANRGPRPLTHATTHWPINSMHWPPGGATLSRRVGAARRLPGRERCWSMPPAHAGLDALQRSWPPRSWCWPSWPSSRAASPSCINAIFFADAGRRVLPATPGRTTMCPVELRYQARPAVRAGAAADRNPAARPVAGRTARARRDAWQRLRAGRRATPQAWPQALTAVTQTQRVSTGRAAALGFWSDSHPHDNPPQADDGSVEVPAWRHAVINYPHPLLQRGLVVRRHAGPECHRRRARADAGPAAVGACHRSSCWPPTPA